MTNPDVSIVLNLHKEGVFLKRTLLSLDAAVRASVAKGLSVELIAVLDRADEATSHVMQEHDLSLFDRSEIIVVENGSLGLSRNDGIARATGEYIMTADGDDLISENFIFDSVATAIAGPKNALYFPEFLFAFGAEYHICAYRPLTEATPLAFIDMHPYISRVCAHRSIFDQYKYGDLRLGTGYAYEDWHFNANAVAYNIDIRIVPNTIIFYRQRQGSLLRQANALSARQIAPSDLFTPETYLAACSGYKKIIQSLSDSRFRSHRPGKSILERTNIRGWVRQANKIEPSIQLSLYENAAIFSNAQHPLDCGIAYYHACSMLRDLQFDDVFLFPFISRGGAEKYFIEVMGAMHRLSPDKNVLALLGESFSGPTWKGKLPPNVVALDLGVLYENLSMDNKCQITLKLLQTCCSEARIHVRQSYFGDECIRRFGPILANRDVFYYHFNDDEGLEDGHVITRNSPLDLISDNFDNIKYIVSDNSTTVRKDSERLGLTPSKWRVLPAPIKLDDKRYFSDDRNLNNILWASRLDYAKRPNIVPEIAQSLIDIGISSQISAYGASVFGHYDPSIFDGSSNLTYRGAFDGFCSLPTEKYGIFIYTSWCDGLPNVLLEAMSHGLVIVAPDVGGISEIIVNKETGILLPSISDTKHMAHLYAEAISEITHNPTLAKTMTRNSFELLANRNSYETYDACVRTIFAYGE